MASKQELKKIAREIRQIKSQLNKSAGIQWESDEVGLRRSEVEKNGWKIVGGYGLTDSWIDITVAKGDIEVKFEAQFTYSGSSKSSGKVIVYEEGDKIANRNGETLDVNYIPRFLADIDEHMVMVLDPKWSPKFKDIMY